MQILDSPREVPLNGNRASTDENAMALEKEVIGDTLSALMKAGVLSQNEVSGFASYLAAKNVPCWKLFPLMAELRKVPEEQFSHHIEAWGRGVANAMKKRYSLITFAPRLLNPTSFYEQFDDIREWARALRVPIIFSEDADVIGLGCINPIACEKVGEKMSEFLSSRVGTRPFITKVLLDYESWDLVCRKHFEL
ncbi:MAG: hypothetical protein Q7Q71_13185 [Verrucomicrobiota bacterium JB023]|nr:hypothetical protein [Verrucomicrobiota bacterium JB023]